MQAMKALRAELAADGRQDILDRVMAYRGGTPITTCSLVWYLIWSRLFSTGWFLTMQSLYIWSLTSD